MGFSKLLNSVGGVISSLVGQDIVARSIRLTQATGLDALTMVTGARLKLGGGTTDFITSDGAATITVAGTLVGGGGAIRLQDSNTNAGMFSGAAGGGTTNSAGVRGDVPNAAANSALSFSNVTTLTTGVDRYIASFFNDAVTTVQARITTDGTWFGGFGPVTKAASKTAPTVVAGAGAAMVASNGTAAFSFNAGAAAQTGTITFPTAVTSWVVYMQNVTTPASFVLSQTGGTTTTATFTCYSRTTGLAINWNANDIIRCIAMGY